MAHAPKTEHPGQLDVKRLAAEVPASPAPSVSWPLGERRRWRPTQCLDHLAPEIGQQSKLLSSDFLAHREGVPQRAADPIVLPVAGREDEWQHLQDVRQAGDVQHLFVGFHVEDLADELGVRA